MKIFCFFILSIIFSNTLNLIKKTATNLIIQGNFSIGNGYSIIFKQKLLEEIKLKLNETLSEDKTPYSIQIVLNNLQISDKYEEETNRTIIINIKSQNLDKESVINIDPEINHEEFNIFLSTDNGETLILIGTSDLNIKSDFYEYLQTGLNSIKRSLFVKSIVKKIKKLLRIKKDNI